MDIRSCDGRALGHQTVMLHVKLDAAWRKDHSGLSESSEPQDLVNIPLRGETAGTDAALPAALLGFTFAF